MLIDERIRTLLSELDAQQAARARLFLHLNLLADICDVRGLVDTLADVATSRARSRSSKERREWERLAEALEGFLSPGAAAARQNACQPRAEGREGP